MATFRTFHATKEGEMFYDFKVKSSRKKSHYECAVIVDAINLNEVFSVCQERPNIRSLSVGDIIQHIEENKFYAVQSVGFVELDATDKEYYFRFV